MRTGRNLWRATVALLALILPVVVHAAPADMPPEWPWRGVVMDVLANTPADVHRVKQVLHANSVQLQLWTTLLAKRDHLSADESWQRSLRWLDAMLDACRNEGVVAIVDANWFPIDNERRYDQTSARFWASANDKAEVLKLVGELASHLSSRKTELAAYDIISEPVMVVLGKAAVPPGWDSFQSEIVRTIRQYDRGRWIVVKPGPWGGPGGYADFQPLPFDRLVYSVHMYEPHAFTHQGIYEWSMGAAYPGVVQGRYWDKAALASVLSPVAAFQHRYHVPVWVGEFSALRWAPGGEQYLKDLTKVFDDSGWGWCYFNFGFWHGWNPDYDNIYEKDEKTANYESHRVGESSLRWETLRQMFNMNTAVKTN